MLSREEVVKFGNKLGFESVGMCSAEPFTDYKKTVKERIRAGLYPKDLMSYEKILENVETYADPSNSLPNAKTIISMTFCYYTSKPTDLTRQGEPHGVLARAYQRGVYIEMHRRREKFAELLRKKGINVAEKSLIPHKMAAIRAGVGWQGKNSLIQTEKFGSWITLNSLIVDAEFEPDEKTSKSCGSCQACLRACPASAIQSLGVINANKCVDYLTCKTGSIPRKLRSSMGNRLVSCDRCQEVCPNNSHVKPVRKKIPRHNPEFRYSPALLPLLRISEKEFEKHFWDCGFIEPTLESLQRNVTVALGNIGDPVAIPTLKRLLKSATPLIKRHTAWALGMINDGEAHKALKEAFSQEQDQAVREEILYALEHMQEI